MSREAAIRILEAMTKDARENGLLSVAVEVVLDPASLRNQLLVAAAIEDG